MLNLARQTLKRVPSFQELLQGKMGSAKEEMYPHRPATCLSKLRLTLPQFCRCARHWRWANGSWSSKAPSPNCMLKRVPISEGQVLSLSGWPLMVDRGLERDAWWSCLHRHDPRRLREYPPQLLTPPKAHAPSSTTSVAMSSSPTTSTSTTASTRRCRRTTTGTPTSASPTSPTPSRTTCPC
jgi:hypothetical protein